MRAQELARITPYPEDRLVRYAAYATAAGLDMDGEHWAVGEMVERAAHVLDVGYQR